jgi:hypothetical protein
MFKRGKKVTYSTFVKKGALLRTEKGGIVEQDKCIYVGHTTSCAEKVMITACQALIRKLFKKLGHDFESFKEPISRHTSAPAFTIGSLKGYYTAADGEDLNSFTITVSSGNTYETIASNLLSQIKLDMVGTADPSHINYKYLEWWPVTQDAAAQPVMPLVKIKLENLSVTHSIQSELTLQNRTLANSGANPEHHDSMLDVENNPLEGYSYSGAYNGMRLRFRDQTGGTHPVLFGDQSSGLIELDPDDVNLSTNEQDLLQRPPRPQMLMSAKRSGRVRLGPGQLKRSYLKSVKTLKWNALIHKFAQYLHNSSQKFIQYYGHNRIYAFEKMMHTTDATEPDMSIGYEINTSYACYVMEKGALVLQDKDVL